jgi:hypothetical protein
MKLIFTFLIFFTFLFSFSTISPVHAMSGQEWLSRCEHAFTKGEDQDIVGAVQAGSCTGFIQGVRDYSELIETLNLYTETGGEYYPFPKVCRPKEVTLGQEIKITQKWLNEHPEELHNRFDFLYIILMRETFPCKSQ